MVDRVAEATESAPSTQTVLDSHFSEAPDGDIVWHGGAGYSRQRQQEEEQSQPVVTGEGEQPAEAQPTLDADLAAIIDEFSGQQRSEPAAPDRPTVAPRSALPEELPPDQAPEGYEPSLLDNRVVQLHESQLGMYFGNRLSRISEAARSSQDPAVQAALAEAAEGWRMAQQASVASLRQRAAYSQMAAVAYQLFRQAGISQAQLAPFRLIDKAKAIAQKYGVDDYRKLIKHPTTGKPITNDAIMEAIASLIGEGQRQQNIANRANVDAPLVGGSTRGGRSIANIDPDSKEFAEIERRVEAGHRVRLVG